MRRGIFTLPAIGLSVFAITSAQAQSIRTVTSTRSLSGESSLTVNVRFGMAVFTMRRESGPQLYRANLAFNEDQFLPVTDYTPSRQTLDLGIRSRREKFDGLDAEDQSLNLTISPDVPTTLLLQFGAGKADVDLGGLRVQSVDVSTGASETLIDFSRPTLSPCEKLRIRIGAAAVTAKGLGNSNCGSLDIKGAAGSITLDFGGEWQSEHMTGEITLGLGGLTLRLPRDIGVAIQLKRFLVPFESEGFEKSGNRYVTPNYGSAASTLELRVEAFLGDVDVEWFNR